MVPFVPGGASDILASAAPDGYTPILGHVGSIAVNPLIYPDSGYYVSHDFAPVTMLANVPSLFVVHKDVPAKDFKSFVAYAKLSPGRLNYARAGNASAGHLAMECLKLASDIFITHIPYGGTGRALNDLPAGRVDPFSAGTPVLLQHSRISACFASESAVIGGAPSDEFAAFIGVSNGAGRIVSALVVERHQLEGWLFNGGTPADLVQDKSCQALTGTKAAKLKNSGVVDRFCIFKRCDTEKRPSPTCFQACTWL